MRCAKVNFWTRTSGLRCHRSGPAGMTFDALLDEVGAFGPFQVLLVVLMASSRLVLPCNLLLNNFIGAVPPHRCKVARWNATTASAVPLGDDGLPQACGTFVRPPSLVAGNQSEATPTVPCLHGWIYDNSTFSSTIATEWDLVCERKHLPQTINIIFFLGLMLGSLLFGLLSDNYGRRRSLLLSYVLSLALGLASAWSDSYVLLAVLRFLSGTALAGVSLVTITLCIEWVNSSHRASMCVIGSLSWSLGNMLLAGLAFLINDWRPLVVAVNAPLALAVLTWRSVADLCRTDGRLERTDVGFRCWCLLLCFARWVPESARWLCANAQVEKAHLYLNKCARANKRPELASKDIVEALSSAGKSKKSKKYTFLHLFKTPKLRKISLVSGIAWYGTAVTYYGISLNLSGFGLSVYLTHFVYAAVEVPARLLIYFLINRIGRRPCLVGTLVLTATCIGVNIFVPEDVWQLRSAVAILGKGLSEASATTIILYTHELYPTVLRQTGLGFTSVLSRVGVSVAPLVLFLEDVWSVLPQVVLCVGAFFCGLLAMLLPETLDLKLPETVQDVETPACSKGQEDVPLETKNTT
ncbi:solute carrier family 22 member 7-like isoform X2 [Vanacampus margaritifer]